MQEEPIMDVAHLGESIGLDTAKAVFQVHAVDNAGNVVIRRKIQRKT